MRVSIINCVSTAYHMIKFSDISLFKHAGHANFDYVVVKWLPSEGINNYLLEELPETIKNYCPIEGPCLHVVEHTTDQNIGYVPNLRAMINLGFQTGFSLNDYCGLANTDCYFGPNWLKNLVKNASESTVVNSLHITPTVPPNPVMGIVTEDLGIPIQGQFNGPKFVQLYDRLYEDRLITAPQDDYRQCATMPYLFHKKYWKKCGPWELTCENGTPDVRFFDRVREAGAEYTLAKNSIVYHHEAVERKGARPAGAEHLKEE